MASYKRGEVVLVDLGMVAKVRPCVVVSIPAPDSQRNMCVVAPMTTEIRNGECEVPFPKPPWLKQPSVINLIGIAGIDNSKIQRRIAALAPETLDKVAAGLARMLGLPQPPTEPAA